MSVQGNSAALCNSATQSKNNRENSMMLTKKSAANQSFSPIINVGMRKPAPQELTTVNMSAAFAGQQLVQNA